MNNNSPLLTVSDVVARTVELCEWYSSCENSESYTEEDIRDLAVEVVFEELDELEANYDDPRYSSCEEASNNWSM